MYVLKGETETLQSTNPNKDNQMYSEMNRSDLRTALAAAGIEGVNRNSKAAMADALTAHDAATAKPARSPRMTRADMAQVLKGFIGRKKSVVVEIAEVAAAGICRSGTLYHEYWSSSDNTGFKAAALIGCTATRVVKNPATGEAGVCLVLTRS